MDYTFDDLIDLIARHDEHEDYYRGKMTEWLSQVKADAWDEGHNHCFHVENPNNPIKGNPYQKEQN